MLASLTGGIDTRVFGAVIRARGAFRPLLIASALLVFYAALNRDEFTRGADRVAALLTRSAPTLAAALALLILATSVKHGSFTAGGSDSYGYVSEAYGWARGELPKPIPLPLNLPFPSSDLLQTPLGYRVGQQPHTMVPTYSPGLPLLMAAGLLVAGAYGPFFVTPVCAALLVWLTFLLARHAAGPIAGAIAALIVAVTPVVLFQALWPMSDVPAAAFWTAALVASLSACDRPTSAGGRFWTGTRKTRAMALLAGVCTAIGLLIRPNVVPLVAAPVMGVATGARGRERWIGLALLLLPVLPVTWFLAALNAIWFGSPLNSGYGAAHELYALDNIWPNVTLYVSWFWQSESPWALVGFAALLPAAWRHADRRALGLCLLTLALTLGCYLPYFQFREWWYLRFLLPAAGAVAALIAVGVVTLARLTPSPVCRVAAGVTMGMLVWSALSYARHAGVFGGARDGERRYVDIGEFVARTLPANAAIFAGQHSGSLRFYGGRMTLRFEFLDRDWAARAPAEIERAGLHPYLTLDDFEQPHFRSQFGLPADSRLPWPVVARMRDLGGLTIWDLGSAPPADGPVALEPGSRQWCSAPLLPLRVR